jgi:hypothetical protein
MSDLRADCTRCEGLCCVVLAFDASPAFAFAKPLNTPCRHLSDDYRCKIHAARPEVGLGGCCQYECYGAGQRATALVPGRSWREDPERARALFAAFCNLLELHELLSLLEAARRLELPDWAASEREQLVAQLEGDASTASTAVPSRRAAVYAFLRGLRPLLPRIPRQRLPVWRSSTAAGSPRPASFEGSPEGTTLAATRSVDQDRSSCTRSAHDSRRANP